MELPDSVQNCHAKEKEKMSPNEFRNLDDVATLAPCPIDSPNTLAKLYKEAQVKLWLKDIIPSYRQPGGAISAGDCFFHSIADSLNQRSGKEEYSIQSLRIFCDEYVKDPKNSWVKDENIKDREDHNNCLVRIRFTAEELLAKEKAGQKLGLATWGRPKIEGRIFCEQYNIRIHVIQIQEDGAIHRYLVDRNGETNDYNPDIDYQDLNILHIINYHNHFVPLLNSHGYIPQSQKYLSQTADNNSVKQEIRQSGNTTTIQGENLPRSKTATAAATAAVSSSSQSSSATITSHHIQAQNASVRRVRADVYTNSPSTFERVSSHLSSLWQRFGFMSAQPAPPLLSTTTADFTNLTVEEIEARLVVEENNKRPNIPSAAPITVTTNISAGIVVLAPEPLPIDLMALRNKLWNLPLRNTNFIGRKELLQKISRRFQPITGENAISQNNNKSAITVVCHGIGGVGKTQIAIELAYRQNNPIVHWVTAETPAQIEAVYVTLAKSLSIFEENQTIDEIIKNVKVWIMNHPRWLLIFDNAHNYSEIEKYIPEHGCDILITSRYTDWPAEIDVKVDLFDIEEARLYIKRILDNRPIDTEGLIDSLANTMGYLPLPLAQACGYIRQNKINIDTFLTKYEQKKQTFLSAANLPPGDKHVPAYVTWDISLEEINNTSKLAAKLLYLCAYLNSDDIPYFLLNELAKDKEFNPDGEDFEESLGLLQRYSLITLNPELQVISIHRVIQEVMRIKLQQARLEELYLIKTMTCLNQLFTYKKYATTAAEWDNTKKVNLFCEKLLNHVSTLAANPNVVALTPEGANSLLLKFAQYLIDVKSNYTLAKLIIDKLTQLHESTTLKQNPLVKADLIREKANLLMVLGKYAEVIAELEVALKLYEENAAPANNVTLLGIIHCQLGNAYYFLQEYRKAESEYDQVLALQTKGQDVAEKINIAAALCGHVHLLGKYGDRNNQSIAILNKILAIYTAISKSKKHKSFADINSLLARNYYECKNYNRAIEFYSKANEMYRTVYGTEIHLDIAINNHNTSNALYKAKTYDKALDYAQSALNGYLTIFESAQDFDSAVMVYQIGFLLCRQEDYKKGIARYQKALYICERIYQPKVDEKNLNSLFHYAYNYCQQGKFKEAEHCFSIIMLDYYEKLKEKGTRVSVISILTSDDRHELNPLLPGLDDRYETSYRSSINLLIRACASGDIDLVQAALLDVRYSDINMGDESGENPLSAAACRGHLRVVVLLVEKCHANICANRGSYTGIDTPLTAAVRARQFKVVDYFVDYLNRQNKPALTWFFEINYLMSPGYDPAPSRDVKMITDLMDLFFSYSRELKAQACEELLTFDKKLLPGLYILRKRKFRPLMESALLQIIFALCATDAEMIIFLLKNVGSKRYFEDVKILALKLLQMLGINNDILTRIIESNPNRNKDINISGPSSNLMWADTTNDVSRIRTDVINITERLNNLLFTHFVFDSRLINSCDQLVEFRKAVSILEQVANNSLATINDIETVASFLIHDHALIRFAARNAILKLKLLTNSTLTSALIKTYSNDNWRIRRDGLENISYMSEYTTDIVTHLSRALNDIHPAVKQAAAIALIKKDNANKEAVMVLQSGLSESNWKLRYQAVVALKILPQIELTLLKQLSDHLIDSDKNVRKATIATLNALAGNHKQAVLNVVSHYLNQADKKNIILEVVLVLREIMTKEDILIAMSLLFIAKDEEYYRNEKNVNYQAFLLIKRLFFNSPQFFTHLVSNDMWISFETLDIVLRILPEFKEQLFKHTIGLAPKFCKFVRTVTDLKIVLNLFSEYSELILNLFKKLIITGNDSLEFLKSLKSSELKELVHLFPREQQLFYDLTVGNDKWFLSAGRQYLSTATELVDIFPQQSADLYNKTVANTSWFSQHVTSLYALERLGPAFPAQNIDLYNRTVANPLWFSEHVTSLYDVRCLGGIFPMQNQDLFTKTIGNANWFINMPVDCRQLEFLADALTEQKQQLYDKFVEDLVWFDTYVVDIDVVNQLINIFPDKKQQIFSKTINNLAWFSEHIVSIFSAKKVLQLAPDEQEVWCHKTVDNPAWVSNYLKTLDEVIESANIFLSRREQLFRTTVADSAWFTANILNFQQIERLAGVFPGQHKELLTQILSVTDGPQKFITLSWLSRPSEKLYVFERLNKTFPDHVSRIFEETVGNKEWFSKNIKSVYDLEVIAKVFTNNQDELYIRSVGNPKWFSANVREPQEVEYALKAFPTKQDQLYAVTAGNKAWFSIYVYNFYRLQDLVKVFPTQRDVLFTQNVNNAEWFSRVTRVYDVEKLIEIFPTQSQAIYERTAGNTNWMTKSLRYEFERNALAKLFPDYRESILTPQAVPTFNYIRSLFRI